MAILKKLKKGLKKIAKPAAAIGGALALANALKKRKQMKTYLQEEGGDRSSILGPLQDNSFLPDDGFISVDNPYGEGGAKKGGSAGRKKRSTITGVAVRGFGRALNRK